MTKPVKEPAMDNDQEENEFLQKMKDGFDALLDISIPTKGMTLDDMRRAQKILSDEHVRLRKK